MSGWRGWIQTLIALVVVLGFLEMLLPDTSIKKFSKLVFGLVLMLAVLQPIMAIVFWDWDTSFPLELSLETVASNYDYWEQEGNRLHQIGSEHLDTQVMAGAIRQIETLALMTEGVEDAKVELEWGSDGSVQGVFVQLDLRVQPVKTVESVSFNQSDSAREDPEFTPGDSQVQVRKVIARALSISPDLVHITLREH